MTGDADEDRNPFASRRTRPAAVDFRFPAGVTASGLVDELMRQGWRGQILGPHGSGKSTLLAALMRELAQRRVVVWNVALHDEQRRLPSSAWQAIRSTAAAAEPRLLVVDGYEQLGRWQRWRLRAACRRRGWGLLVTAHADCGLPTLARTSASLDLALELARRWEPAVDEAAVRQAFEAHQGNLREVWFGLYDLYEQRRIERLDRDPPNRGP